MQKKVLKRDFGGNRGRKDYTEKLVNYLRKLELDNMDDVYNEILKFKY